jgi:glutaminyl-tRNA synthetase
MNPNTEKEEYFVAIKDIIRWLGFPLAEITYASDNFQRTYDFAEALVKEEKACVCHFNEAETKLQRSGEDSSNQDIGANMQSKPSRPTPRSSEAYEMASTRPQIAWLWEKQDIDIQRNKNTQLLNL